MTREKIKQEYFEWLIDLVCKNRYSEQVSYRELLTRLHKVEFSYVISRDANRADDGINLRYRFALSNGYEDCDELILYYLRGACSVLEMMIALASKCEDIMDDPDYGDRTGQWFWGMIVNLGLGAMTDNRIDHVKVQHIIGKFLTRDYEPNGKGGLFTVKNTEYDLRDVEIWKQMCYYLDNIA